MLILKALRTVIDVKDCSDVLDISRAAKTHRGYDNNPAPNICKGIYYSYYSFFAGPLKPADSLEKHGLMAALVSIAAVRLAVDVYVRRVLDKYGNSKSRKITNLVVDAPEIVYIEDNEGVKLYCM